MQAGRESHRKRRADDLDVWAPNNLVSLPPLAPALYVRPVYIEPQLQICGSANAVSTHPADRFQPAAVSQILHDRLTAVLHANDVVDLMTECRVLFRKQAIFTPEARSAGDLLSKCLRDVRTHERLGLEQHELSSES